MLVGGWDGETRILTVNNNGQASYGKQIDGFGDKINCLIRLSDRQILACGSGGETRILTINDDGQASYGKQIDGFENDISYILQLSEQQVLVCSWTGMTKVLNLSRSEPSLEHLKLNIDRIIRD